MPRRDRLTMLLAYVAAASLAALLWRQLPDVTLWARTLITSLAATGLLWLVGVLRGNPSVFDPYWSVAPIAVAAAWASDPGSAPACVARQFLVLCLVGAWGLRLTYHWRRTITGLAHEDWRYTDMRRASGRQVQAV